MGADGWMEADKARYERTVALADQLIGLTEVEVLRVMREQPANEYRVIFVHHDHAASYPHDLDRGRMYLIMKGGRVVRHESGS